MIRAITMTLGSMFLALAGGCSAYVDNFYYAPHPALAEITAVGPQPVAAPPPMAMTQPQMAPMPQPAAQPQPPVVSSFASVVGIRNADGNQGIPHSVQIRLQLVNRGGQSVVFDPRTLELMNGSLMRFPPPMVRPPQPISLVPQQPAVIDVYFPFPAGYTWENTELETLQLRWATAIDGRPVAQQVDFHRIHGYYYHRPYYDYEPYDPYYPYGPYVVGGGVVVVHRRW